MTYSSDKKQQNKLKLMIRKTVYSMNNDEIDIIFNTLDKKTKFFLLAKLMEEELLRENNNEKAN